MRQSLMRSFEQIYILDLHGNAKKKERAPDGSNDENVFDIEQGVAVSVFVKRRGLERGVWRGDAWGKRLDKYKFVSQAQLRQSTDKRLTTTKPLYLFEERTQTNADEYELGTPLTQIFPTSVLGFQSHRDDFAFAFERQELTARLEKFRNADNAQAAAEEFFPGPKRESPEAKNKRVESVRLLRERVAGATDLETYISLTSYFPFDNRWCVYNKAVVDRPRRELVQNVYLHDNICLNVVRQTKQHDWRHSLVSSLPTTPLFIETKDGSYVFPIFLYSADNNATRRENLDQKFRATLDERYDYQYSCEEILGFIYAVLSAGAYRDRYREFLRSDFPRIPFPENSADFEALSELGWELIQAHLLNECPDAGLAKLDGKGDEMVEAVRYSEVEKAVWINKTQCFKPVPEDVWNFHIGGYQVLEKYLKSRKGRQLSLDEAKHVSKVADSLAFTIAQMKKIDIAYKKAFPA